MREHLSTFLAEQADHGQGLPGFVIGEFERYLDCGILAKGFARVRCPSCGDELLVAFSCKGRGFCPSCATRRMQRTSAHLLDHVLPAVPMRQWVLSLPRWARFLLARDPALITRALDLALRAIFTLQRRRARRLGAIAPRCGAVTFVQRFGGALNLNVHFHCVLPDGVFVREGEGARFIALPRPLEHELRAALKTISGRIQALLRPIRESTSIEARAPDALTAAQADSVGRVPWKPARSAEDPRTDSAYTEGFSLHAGVHIHANDRAGLAHLCGYGGRPPLSQQRLSQLPDGRLQYRLKRPRAGGAEALVLEPRELLRKLAALVPPPRAHLVRYHGVFAPASSWRPQVIPKPPEPSSGCDAGPDAPAAAAPPPPKRHPSRIPWAELLRRVFLVDVLSCPCGGCRVVLAFITEPKVIEEILDHLGLPAAAPLRAPVRFGDEADASPWQDDVPTLQRSLH